MRSVRSAYGINTAATAAPKSTTAVTDVQSMIGPAMRPPTATAPPNAITQIAITRPRTESSSRFWSTVDSDVTVDALLKDLKTALDDVRSQASTFGSNLSIVQNRKAFTTAMIDTLETGAGNLTLADMNTEAANLLALQTRQQLSQNSLSLASQADQSILQLLR